MGRLVVERGPSHVMGVSYDDVTLAISDVFYRCDSGRMKVSWDGESVESGRTVESVRDVRVKARFVEPIIDERNGKVVGYTLPGSLKTAWRPDR